MKNKILSILLIATFVILSLSMVSASHYGGCPGSDCEKTFVEGRIYEGEYTNGINGAKVQVTCNGNTESTVSHHGLFGKGTYYVKFSPDECDVGDEVTVTASKNGLSGANDGSVTWTYNWFGCDINVGIINVPLVPEFGVIVGGLTLISAVGIFFFVRKR